MIKYKISISLKLCLLDKKNTVTCAVNNTIDLSVKTFIATNHTLSTKYEAATVAFRKFISIQC